MKYLLIFIFLFHFTSICNGQEYLVTSTFTLKEPRLLVFDEDNIAQHDSLINAFKLQKYTNQTDSIKALGVITYYEGLDKLYIFRLKTSPTMIVLKKQSSASIIDRIDLMNDLTWAIENVKFENMISIFHNIDNIEDSWKDLKLLSKATYGGLNISKFRNIIESNKDKYKEFLF